MTDRIESGSLLAVRSLPLDRGVARDERRAATPRMRKGGRPAMLMVGVNPVGGIGDLDLVSWTVSATDGRVTRTGNPSLDTAFARAYLPLTPIHRFPGGA